jgi:lysophospholipase L1-like esterase
VRVVDAGQHADGAGRATVYAVLLLALAMLVMAAVELAARRLLPGDLSLYRRLVGDVPIHLAIFRTADGLFGTPPYPHEADARLCWRNRPGYAREPFRVDTHGVLSPEAIPYARRDGRYRLLVLGDSSSAGLGLDSHADTWPQQLQRRRADAVEVVNAATIGYSSEQARRSLRRAGRRYRPDGVAVYLGNNDPVGSAMTDRALLARLAAPKGPVARLETWFLDHSVAYLVAKVGARFALTGGGRVVAADIRTQRVPQARFRDNLRAIVRWARKRGRTAYLITPPTPLEYPPKILEYNVRAAYDPRMAGRDACLDDGEAAADIVPAMLATADTAPRYPKPDHPIARYAERVLGCFTGRLDEQRARFERELGAAGAPAVVYNNLGWIQAAGGDDVAALAFVRQALERAPEAPEFHYNAGMLELRRGGAVAGAAHLQRAIDVDPSGVKIHSGYLAELRALAAREPSAVLVDAHAAFRAGDNELLFSDHVHPNVRGQALIAELVGQAIDTRAAAPTADGRAGER